jgi:simple sugar transport system ATP-binding protein
MLSDAKMTEGHSPILEVRGISKRFPGVQALSGVNFRMFEGEVHALMGQNGAGKSTLIKVLTGVYPSDSGQITLDGKIIQPTGPLDAQRCGISTVYQEVNLCPNLSVAENILLGRGQSNGFALSWKDMRKKARALLAELHIDIDVLAPLSTYSIAVQQMCAIARSLVAQAKILILDEPTSSLSEDEVELLFSVIRRLKSQGMGVLFITHFLDQTYEISDRITVLRNGELVGEYLAADLSRIELVNKMVGREVLDGGQTRAQRVEGRESVAGAEGAQPESSPLLRATGLGRRGSVQGVELEIRRGEAVGMAGLLGSGRTETARLLFGIDKADEGSITIDGKPTDIGSPLGAIKAGIAFCSEDRKLEGIIADLSVRENIILALQAKQGVFRFLSRKRQEDLADSYISLLGIKTNDAEMPIGKLSGGNQQKALLARWMAINPSMLILDEPTRGIDVVAKLEIMGQVMELCDNGMAVLFISSEMDEVLRYSDRIAVMRDRRKVGEFATAETSEQEIFHLIAEGTDDF